MKKRLATYLNCLVLGSVLLGACSRPVAYFQRSTALSYAPAQTASVVTDQTLPAQPASPAEATAVPANELTASSAQAVEQLEAYVRNDTKLSSNKRLTKRLDRIRNLVAESTANKAVTAAGTQHKTTVLERLMTKKLDRKISKHLAPNQPNKPMINGGLLTGSLILLLAGILLLLLTSGTAATIGLIAAIIGAIGLIFGLLAS